MGLLRSPTHHGSNGPPKMLVSKSPHSSRTLARTTAHTRVVNAPRNRLPLRPPRSCVRVMQWSLRGATPHHAKPPAATPPPMAPSQHETDSTRTSTERSHKSKCASASELSQANARISACDYPPPLAAQQWRRRAHTPSLPGAARLLGGPPAQRPPLPDAPARGAPVPRGRGHPARGLKLLTPADL